MTTYRMRTDRLEWREVEGEVVLLDVKSSQYLAINESGAVLWPMLREGSSKPQMAEALIERFGIDEATAARDVDAFIDVLKQQDLLA